MNPGMPQYGMPSGASSGAPYFNVWSPYGGFASPQGGYGMSSPFGGFGGSYVMPSPYSGYGGSGFGSPFGSPYGGFGGFGYSSPFSQFQTPNFAAKGSTTQPQSSSPPSPLQSPTPYNGPQGGAMAPPPPSDYYHMGSPAVSQPLNLMTNSIAPPGGLPNNPGYTPGNAPPSGIAPTPQAAPIPQAVPPQMMNPVSGPVQMLPQQMFNQTRIQGANSVLPGRNMLIGGYR